MRLVANGILSLTLPKNLNEQDEHNISALTKIKTFKLHEIF